MKNSFFCKFVMWWDWSSVVPSSFMFGSQIPRLFPALYSSAFWSNKTVFWKLLLRSFGQSVTNELLQIIIDCSVFQFYNRKNISSVFPTMNFCVIIQLIMISNLNLGIFRYVLFENNKTKKIFLASLLLLDFALFSSNRIYFLYKSTIPDLSIRIDKGIKGPPQTRGSRPTKKHA